MEKKISYRDYTTTLLFSILLGFLGVHRFYVNKIGTGIVWLLTGGCLGIGWLIDIILVATGAFQDKEGGYITPDAQKREAGTSTDSAPAKNGYYTPYGASRTSSPSQSAAYMEQLERLAKLKENGAITQEEYDEKKKSLLEKIG